MLRVGYWIWSIQHPASIGSTVQINRPDDIIQIVLDLHRAICERGPVDAATAEHAVELSLIGCVVCDRGSRILELMPGENANDPLAGFDDSFFAEHSSPGNARRAGWFTTQPIRADLRLGVKHLLVRHLAYDSAAALQRSQTLVQIPRPIDLYRARNRRSPPCCVVELRIV